MGFNDFLLGILCADWRNKMITYPEYPEDPIMVIRGICLGVILGLLLWAFAAFALWVTIYG